MNGGRRGREEEAGWEGERRERVESGGRDVSVILPVLRGVACVSSCLHAGTEEALALKESARRHTSTTPWIWPSRRSLTHPLPPPHTPLPSLTSPFSLDKSLCLIQSISKAI